MRLTAKQLKRNGKTFAKRIKKCCNNLRTKEDLEELANQAVEELNHGIMVCKFHGFTQEETVAWMSDSVGVLGWNYMKSKQGQLLERKHWDEAEELFKSALFKKYCRARTGEELSDLSRELGARAFENSLFVTVLTEKMQERIDKRPGAKQSPGQYL